jgi:cytochrome P450
MTGASGVPLLDRDRIRELFDLRNSFLAITGGENTTDPYPTWHELRERGPVLEGTLHELSGFGKDDAFWHGLPYPDAPHFTAFSWDAVDAAHRNDEVFSSTPFDQQVGALNSMLTMSGTEHRRHRALVQPSFMPAKARWWIEQWIEATVHALIDSFVHEGRAELNVDFCAAIPILTITGSFGIPVEQALDIRASMHDPSKLADAIAELVELRRDDPRDDLITVLLQAELADEHGVSQRLSDEEIQGFASLLLTAGSGTTWKQMGITLAALLQRPEVLAAVRDDRSLLRAAIEESVRWQPTDPMFSRWVRDDTELAGVAIPGGSVVHLCLGAANRDPSRWDDPDTYDIHRPIKPSVGFGGGPHICLGMHVARAEMTVGIGALLDRLPNLHLDPAADPPQTLGFYERGVTAIPVRFDA